MKIRGGPTTTAAVSPPSWKQQHNNTTSSVSVSTPLFSGTNNNSNSSFVVTKKSATVDGSPTYLSPLLPDTTKILATCRSITQRVVDTGCRTVYQVDDMGRGVWVWVGCECDEWVGGWDNHNKNSARKISRLYVCMPKISIFMKKCHERPPCCCRSLYLFLRVITYYGSIYIYIRVCNYFVYYTTSEYREYIYIYMLLYRVYIYVVSVWCVKHNNNVHSLALYE